MPAVFRLILDEGGGAAAAEAAPPPPAAALITFSFFQVTDGDYRFIYLFIYFKSPLHLVAITLKRKEPPSAEDI